MVWAIFLFYWVCVQKYWWTQWDNYYPCIDSTPTGLLLRAPVRRPDPLPDFGRGIHRGGRRRQGDDMPLQEVQAARMDTEDHWKVSRRVWPLWNRQTDTRTKLVWIVTLIALPRYFADKSSAAASSTYSLVCVNGKRLLEWMVVDGSTNNKFII